MLHTSEPRWFAVYTKYKREKLVSKYLVDKGIVSYLPLQKVTRMYTRKIKKVELPLINCYIFVCITREQYVRVLETPDVVHFVKIAKDLISIPEKEIDILRKDISSHIVKLKKAEYKRKLTKEEINFLEQFEEELTEAKSAISKEIEDIAR